MWWGGATLVALLATMPAGAGAQVEQPRALETFAVLGLEDATLGAGADVQSGNVGANRGTVTLRPHAAVAGSVLGDTIALAGLNRVGALFCTFVRGPLRFGCTTLVGPVVDVSRLAFVQVRPGAGDVEVPSRTSTAPLPPGAYGRVSVGSRARLMLAGGTYELRALDVAARGNVLCAAGCRLRVRERVRLGRRAVLSSVAPLEATQLRVDVESQGRRPSFTAGTHATVDGSVYAPGGDIVLGARGRYEGAFVGRSVTVGTRARLKLASAL
jgi:hypothetical protein